MPNIRQLVAISLRHYPNSKFMRHQWLRWTIYLYKTKRHALLTGGFSRQSV